MCVQAYVCMHLPEQRVGGRTLKHFVRIATRRLCYHCETSAQKAQFMFCWVCARSVQHNTTNTLRNKCGGERPLATITKQAAKAVHRNVTHSFKLFFTQVTVIWKFKFRLKWDLITWIALMYLTSLLLLLLYSMRLPNVNHTLKLKM